MNYVGQIFEFIQKLLVWWVTIMPWEEGVFVRGGKRTRIIKAGIHFRIPFYDQVYVQTTRMRVVQGPLQTVTTMDGKTITIVMNMGYTIQDISRLYNTLYHADQTLCNMMMGIVADEVYARDLKDCIPSSSDTGRPLSSRYPQYKHSKNIIMETFYICLAAYLVAIVTHGLCRVYFQPIIVYNVTQTKEIKVGPHNLQQFKEEMIWEIRYPEMEEWSRQRYQPEMQAKLMDYLWKNGMVYYREDERSGPCMDKEIHARMIIQVMPPDKLFPNQRF